jgi:hypothetical protein
LPVTGVKKVVEEKWIEFSRPDCADRSRLSSIRTGGIGDKFQSLIIPVDALMNSTGSTCPFCHSWLLVLDTIEWQVGGPVGRQGPVAGAFGAELWLEIACCSLFA